MNLQNPWNSKSMPGSRYQMKINVEISWHEKALQSKLFNRYIIEEKSEKSLS